MLQDERFRVSEGRLGDRGAGLRFLEMLEPIVNQP